MSYMSRPIKRLHGGQQLKCKKTRRENQLQRIIEKISSNQSYLIRQRTTVKKV